MPTSSRNRVIYAIRLLVGVILFLASACVLTRPAHSQQINLATQARGVLAPGNGGTGLNVTGSSNGCLYYTNGTAALESSCGFSGVLTSQQVATAGILSNNTSGTASHLATAPSACPSGQAFNQFDAYGNPVVCIAVGGGSAPTGPLNYVGTYSGSGSGSNYGLTHSNIFVGTNGNDLNIPGTTYTATQKLSAEDCPQGSLGYNSHVCAYSNAVFTGDLGLANGYTDQTLESMITTYGPGRDIGNYPGLGNAAPWRVAQNQEIDGNFYSRGISALIGGISNKYSVGDENLASWYGYNVGGCFKYSDQCGTGINIVMSEFPSYYQGTITATTGLGDTAPSLSASTNGFNVICDGCMLVDVTQGTIAGNITGFGVDSVTGLPTVASSVAIPLSTAVGTVGSSGYGVLLTAYSISGGVFTATLGANSLAVGQPVMLQGFQGSYAYLNNAVLTLATVSQTTITAPTTLANGASNNITGAVANQLAYPGQTNTIHIPVTLGLIGSAHPAFTTGFAVIPGSQNPETTFITAVGTPSGTSQVITFTATYPNTGPFIIMQGGIAGDVLSADAIVSTFNQEDPTYFAWGSLDGTNIISGYYSQDTRQPIVDGTSEGQQTPVNPTAGTNNGFHLRPAAEVAVNTNGGMGFALVPNNVHFQVGDVIVNPHPPAVGETGATIAAIQDTPTTTANPGAGLNLLCGSNHSGPNGTSAGGITAGFSCLNIVNLNNPANYSNNGGPVAGGTGLAISGPWAQNLNLGGHPINFILFSPDQETGTQGLLGMAAAGGTYSVGLGYTWSTKTMTFPNSALSVDYDLTVGANIAGSGLTGSLFLKTLTNNAGSVLGLGANGLVEPFSSSQIQSAIGSNVYAPYGSSTGVSSINTLTGAVVFAAGSNVTLTPSGNTITVAASGGGSNVPTGTPNVAAGTQAGAGATISGLSGGNDAGVFTVNTGAVTTNGNAEMAIVTFSSTWSGARSCVVFPGNADATFYATFISSLSTTGWSLNNQYNAPSASSPFIYYYQCK